MKPTLRPGVALLALGLTLLTGCLRPVKLAQPEPATSQLKSAIPTGPEAVVVPLAFAASEYNACLAVGGRPCKEKVVMVHSAFLVKSGKHTFLIDAGLGGTTQAWVGMFPPLQRKLLKVDVERTLAQELARFEVGADALEGVVITHAHWDHLVGLADLPKARVIMPQTEVDWSKSLGKRGHDRVIREVLALRHLTIDPFAWDGPPVMNFPASHDLFGDGSVILLPLPGHTPGSTAVLLPNVGGKPVLFVGDTVWNRAGYKLPAQKPRAVSRMVDANKKDLGQSIQRLHYLYEKEPRLVMVPAHDLEAWEEVKALSKPWEIVR